MRFLHTADLHIGKQLNDILLLQDQVYILDQIADIAEKEEVDCVLISGDVYQKATPQGEAMAAFNSFVTRLTRDGHKVFVISGNHDSEQRIAYFSELIRGAGVYVNDCFEGKIQQIELNDAYGKLVVHLLPFLKPAQVRRFFPGEKIVTSQDAVSAALKNSPVDPKARNVLLCHQFITGAERCDSENVTVGGLDNVDADVFRDYDYVALGHIHKPQKALRESLRYAGSPLKYSFSEVEHRKSIAIVDLCEKGETHVRTVPLKPLREMRLIDGKLDDILQMPYSEDYVAVTVHDEIVPPDAKLMISANVFPNMMRFTVENSKTKTTMDVLVKEKIENRSVTELFTDFFRFQNNDAEPTQAHLDLLEKVCRKLEDEER